MEMEEKDFRLTRSLNDAGGSISFPFVNASLVLLIAVDSFHSKSAGEARRQDSKTTAKSMQLTDHIMGKLVEAVLIGSCGGRRGLDLALCRC